MPHRRISKLSPISPHGYIVASLLMTIILKIRALLQIASIIRITFIPKLTEMETILVEWGSLCR